MEETGYCWQCGHQVKTGLFCNEKHKKSYELKRRREQSPRVGKRGGYGLAGATR